MAWRKLEDTFHSDRKVRKLARELCLPEPHAAGHIVTLWSWALLHAKDGDLSKFDTDDIEYGAKWDGAHGDFLNACVKSRLIDRDDAGSMLLHNWLERGGSYAESQRKAAKKQENELGLGNSGKIQESLEGFGRKRKVPGKAAQAPDDPQKPRSEILNDRTKGRKTARHGQRKPLKGRGISDVPGNSGKIRERPGNSSLEENRIEENILHTCRPNEPLNDRATTSGGPGAKAPAVADHLDDGSSPARRRDDIQEVWSHYRTHHPRVAAELKSARPEYRLIRQRLEDYAVDDLKQAIDGYHRSPWHNGQNDRNRKYLSLELMPNHSKPWLAHSKLSNRS